VLYLGIIGLHRVRGTSCWEFHFWNGARKRIGGVK
jgi:hypothetical protein